MDVEPDNFTEEDRDQILDWTKQLVAFSTYRRDGSTDDEAFKDAVKRGLGWLENWAAERGIKTYNWQNQILELRLGEGRPITGLAAHLDVVPPGEEPWEHGDPFEVNVREIDSEAVLYGRGVVDDKGPLASLLAVFDRFSNHPEDRIPGTLVLIVDTAEEVGFGTVREYLNEHPDRIPDRSLVSDGYFPLVAGEKGLLWFDLEISPDTWSPSNFELLELSAGSAYNQVPDTARLRLEISEADYQGALERISDQYPDHADRLKADYHDGILTLDSEGEPSHGAQPEDGVNAIAGLLLFLDEIDPDVDLFSKLRDLLDGDGQYLHDGTWIGIEDEDQRFETGTTLNFGKIRYRPDDGTFTLSFDARLMPDQPIDSTMTALRKGISSMFPDGYETTITTVNREEALLINMDDVLPETALEAYRDVKGEPEAQPVYMGGRTHGTAIPDCFAFGLMNFEEAHSYNFHGRNERVPLSELLEAAEVYYQTLMRLNGG